MTNFLVNLLSPIFTNLGVSVADLTSYIERLSGYIIAILVALVAMIVVMIAAHKAKKGVRHVIRWQAGIAFVAIVAVLVNVICYGPMYNNVSSILNAKKVELSKETTEQSRETIQKVGEEGMVLLKNKGILPLASDTKKLNVFGWDSTNPLYGGTGSGSSDSSTAISILQSLKDAGYETNESLTKMYTDYREDRPTIAMAEQDWTLPEPTKEYYTDSLMNEAKEFSDTAVVVIGRSGGEGADLPTDMKSVIDGSYKKLAETVSVTPENYGYVKGSYTNNGDYDDFDEGESYLELSNTEEDMLDTVCSQFENVIVVVNANNAMELDWVDKYEQIGAVIYAPGAGATGFEALGEIINGSVNPSGKTVDTFVKDLQQTPYYNNMGLNAYTNVDDLKNQIAKNGQFSTASDWASHKKNTNAGTSSEDGIWFGTSEPDDSKGALLYDTYEIEELSCESNKGMKLIPAFEVVVSRNKVTIDLGTLTDEYEKEITIHTTATDKETGEKIIVAGKKVTIVDTVTLEGLEEGRKYQLKGWQMLKEENAELLIDGKRVESDYTFVADNEKMKVENSYMFDASELGGQNLVTFEELYDLKNPEEPIKVAEHKDIDDEGQTVLITERKISIHTTATDKNGKKEMEAGKDLTIVDTVTLEGLEIGTNYKLSGWQMVKAENAKLLIDGKEVTNDYEFTADKENMEVQIEFTFNGSTLGGKQLVTFEELYDMTNPEEPKKVTEHKDINDEGQTVTIKKVPETPIPETPGTTTKTSNPPKTGDTANAALWIAILVLSAAGITGVRIWNKKKQVKRLGIEKKKEEEE